MIVGQQLEYSFGRDAALRGVDIVVPDGRSVAVVGPSGCGKSTLLLCLAGILAPQGGSVRYDDTLLSALNDAERCDIRARDFGFVMQFGDLVPELTWWENISLGLLLRHEKVDRQKLSVLVKQLDLAGLEHRFPGEVSGGERQRAAVARAVLAEPRVVFADEPTGALDSANGETVMELLFEQTRNQGTSLVVVTHDESRLGRFDEVVRLRDGKVVGA